MDFKLIGHVHNYICFLYINITLLIQQHKNNSVIYKPVIKQNKDNIIK